MFITNKLDVPGHVPEMHVTLTLKDISVSGLTLTFNSPDSGILTSAVAVLREHDN